MVVRVLVVDDEPTVALLFRQCFRRETRASSHVTYFANCCEDALHLLRTGVKPHLILSDINMPGMDGLQCCWARSRSAPGTSP